MKAEATMRPERVRVIEWQELTRSQASKIGLSERMRAAQLADLSRVAVVRCVDENGAKVTALGAVERFQKLLRSGEARDRGGMTLDRFPGVVMPGWLEAG